MVHALVEIHRVLALGGILVDARPDSRVVAYAERVKGRGFERVGHINSNAIERGNDRASDRAIARALHDGMFKRRRDGRFWHRVPFANLAAFRTYLREHQRFVHRVEWLVDEATTRSFANDRFAIRRAVRYDILQMIRSG